MCLAVLGKLISKQREIGEVDIEGNVLTINLQLTPDVDIGDFVLIHAGFSIERLMETEVFDILKLQRQSAW